MSIVVAPDTSEFNPAGVASRLERPVWIFRCTFGAHYLDPKFLENANAAAAAYKAGKIVGAALYTVYLDSASVQEQFAAFWRAVGPQVPAWMLGVEIDAETWRGQNYAMRGDHSANLNALYGMHAGRMRSATGCWGYGNRGDLAEMWSKRDPRCNVVVAKYTRDATLDVRGAIGVQYTDGQAKYGTPTLRGVQLPRVSQPFGAVDHNVFPTFTSAAALRAHFRPPTAPTVPTKPAGPAKPVTPAALYAKPSGAAGELVSPDRRTAWIPTNDGRLEVRHDRKHVGYVKPSA